MSASIQCVDAWTARDLVQGLSDFNFGSAWAGEHNQAFVLECLRRYIRDESHEWALKGQTVRSASRLIRDEYAFASREELLAIACLLCHNKGDEII
jgi:hypothetical protein